MSDLGFDRGGAARPQPGSPRRRASRPIAPASGSFTLIPLPGRWATSFVAHSSRQRKYVVLQPKTRQPQS